MDYTRVSTLIVVDAFVEDYQVLIDSIVDQILESTKVVVLDSAQDGVSQITKTLADFHSIESLHIISHGQPGYLRLGTAVLSSETLPFYVDRLQQWTQALIKTGSILLYGCQIAADVAGRKFVQALHNITQRAIAASTTLTGCVAQGGDWNLDVQIGEIRAPQIFQPSTLATYAHVLPAPNLLYGSGTGAASSSLKIISTSDGAATTDGTLLFSTFAIARDATTGRIYYIESKTDGQVAYFDPATKTNQLVGNTGVNVTFYKLAQSVSGQMYGMDNTTSNLYTINQATGNATSLGAIKVGATNLKVGSGDIAFDPTDPNRLFVTVPDGTIALYTVDIDPTSANYLKATPIQKTALSITSMGALAFGADGQLYTVSNGRLYRLDRDGIAAPSEIGTMAGDYSDFASLPVVTPTADLQIIVSDGVTTTTANSSITYTVTITNSSTTDLTGISVSDLVPVEITGVTWTAVVTGGGGFPTTADESGTGNDIKVKVNLNAGASVTYTVTGTVDSAIVSGTVLSNTATVSSDGINDPNLSNNNATDTTTVVAGISPTITVNTLSTTDRTPQLTGTVSDPNAIVKVTVNGQTYTANNVGDGTWVLPNDTITTELADKTYSVTAVATDANGTILATDTTSDELIIDGPPVVTVNVLSTGDSTPQLTGTVDDPNAIVTVTVNGKSYTATNNKNGTWTLPDNVIQPVLADGTYSVLASAKDAGGNIGIDNTSNELTIDSTIPQVIVKPIDSLTGEDGSTGSFQVVLNRQPTANVTLTFTTSDVTEGIPKAKQIIFTPSNWNTPQTIVVSGVDDAAIDGNIAYRIKTSVSSTDSRYDGIAVAGVELTNADNEKLIPNQLPITANVNSSVVPGKTIQLSGLTATDSDGTIASYIITSLPPTTHGKLFLNNPATGGKAIQVGQVLTPNQIRQIFFQASSNFTGTSFSYTAKDNLGATDVTPATVRITPSPLNAPPEAKNVNLVLNPGQISNISGLLATDVDNAISSYTITTLPATEQGILYLGNPAQGGTLVRVGQTIPATQIKQLFFQATNSFSQVRFTYTATDATGITDRTPATVVLSTESTDSCDCDCESGLNLRGTPSKNTLRGTPNVDRINGHKGNDILHGWGCDDNVKGGHGKDRIFGDGGNDSLKGGVGSDRLRGGAGTDRLQGGRGRDRLRGGTGNDVLRGQKHRDRLWGGTGKDVLAGGLGHDRLHGNVGEDRLLGNRGRDRLRGGTGNDWLHGGVSRDRLNGGNDNDTIRGGRGRDALWGRKGNDILLGGQGQDVLWGYDGDDLLIGGLKRDKITGGAGNDTLIGGRRADRLIGGIGRDRFVYRATSDRGDYIVDFGRSDVIDLSRLVDQTGAKQTKSWKELINLTQVGSAVVVQVNVNQDQSDRFATFRITLGNTNVNELGQQSFVI